MNKYRMTLPSGRALLTRLRTIERQISVQLEKAEALAGDNQTAKMALWTSATDRARWEMARLLEKAVLDNHVIKGAIAGGHVTTDECRSYGCRECR